MLGSCGTELPPNSRFCNKCGAPINPAATSAEYKQVTVLFADLLIPWREHDLRCYDGTWTSYTHDGET